MTEEPQPHLPHTLLLLPHTGCTMAPLNGHLAPLEIPQGGPEVPLPAGEASGRREAAGAQREPLPDMGMWLSQTFQLT